MGALSLQCRQSSQKERHRKYLFYRERSLLRRALTPAELRHVRDTARRLAALRLMGPALDASYRACPAAHVPLAEAG